MNSNSLSTAAMSMAQPTGDGAFISPGLPEQLVPLEAEPEPLDADVETQILYDNEVAPKIPLVKTAQEVCPSPFKGKEGVGKRAQLGNLVRNCVMGGTSERNAMALRNKRNEKFYRNRPEAVFTSGKPWDGAPQYHLPIAAPRLTQRKNAAVETITSASPMFHINNFSDEERAKDVEHDLDFMLRIGGFTKTFRTIFDMCMCLNRLLLKVDFVNSPSGYSQSRTLGPYAGFQFTVIHPDNALVYPANHPDIEFSRFVASRFELRRADVVAKQRTKIWFDDVNPIGNNQPLRTEDEHALQVGHNTTGQEDDSVWMISGLIRFDADDDGVEEVYRVIAEERQGDIYRIEPYEPLVANYIPFGIYEDLNAFWPEDSPANDAQSVQLIFNDIFNNILYNFMYSTRPANVAQGMDTKTSLRKLKPGSITAVGKITDVKQLSGQMNLTGIDFVLNMLIAVADSVTKVPNTVSAGPSMSKNPTATEENIKFSGFQLMGSDDIAAVEGSLIAMARICLWLMYKNFDAMKKVYGNRLKVTDPNVFWGSYEIALAGTTPKASPQVQQEQISTLMSLFAQIPELQPMVMELVEKYVTESSLTGKEDLVAQIKQVREAQDMQAQLMALLQQLGPEFTNYVSDQLPTAQAAA